MSAQADAFAPAIQFAVDGQYLAAVYGVSTRQVRNYVSDGMPTLARDRYDVRECVQWWVDNYKTSTKATTEVTARSKLADAQRERVELELEERRAKLVPAADVAETLNVIATSIASLHDGFGPRCASDLAHDDDPASIQRYLFKELRKMRDQIADNFGVLAEKMAKNADETAKKPPRKTRKPREKTAKPPVSKAGRPLETLEQLV